MRGSLATLLVIVLVLWTLLAAGCQAVRERPALSSAAAGGERSVRELRSAILDVEAAVRQGLRPRSRAFGAGVAIPLSALVPWPWPSPWQGPGQGQGAGWS